jgi:hypothetical protein
MHEPHMAETKTEIIQMAAEEAQDAADAARTAGNAAEAAETAAETAAKNARQALHELEEVQDAAEKKEASSQSFELCTAILLGLGAIFSGVTSHQSGLWDGNSLEAYSQASTICTQAADAASLANAIITHDNNVNLQAMQLIWRAQLLAPESQERGFLLHQASVFYLRQASDEAYDALTLPEEARKTYRESGLENIPEEELLMLQRKEFSPDYYAAMYKDSETKYQEAKAKFDEGSHANSAGDYFSLAGVYYSLSLFFAGIGLVFKTRVRWAFFCLGSLIFIGSTIYLTTLEWA